MDLRRRITRLFSDPRREWTVIAAEPADASQIFTRYVLVLAAIPAAALLIGFGWTGPVTAIAAALEMVITWLVATLLTAVVIERLAPKFSSTDDFVRALKLVAYASTPVWLAGIVYILPGLAWLVILAAIYAAYLFYVGLPIVLNTPYDKVVPFMVVAAITVLVIQVVLQLAAQTLGF